MLSALPSRRHRALCAAGISGVRPAARAQHVSARQRTAASRTPARLSAGIVGGGIGAPALAYDALPCRPHCKAACSALTRGPRLSAGGVVVWCAELVGVIVHCRRIAVRRASRPPARLFLPCILFHRRRRPPFGGRSISATEHVRSVHRHFRQRLYRCRLCWFTDNPGPSLIGERVQARLPYRVSAPASLRQHSRSRLRFTTATLSADNLTVFKKRAALRHAHRPPRRRGGRACARPRLKRGGLPAGLYTCDYLAGVLQVAADFPLIAPNGVLPAVKAVTGACVNPSLFRSFSFHLYRRYYLAQNRSIIIPQNEQMATS